MGYIHEYHDFSYSNWGARTLSCGISLWKLKKKAGITEISNQVRKDMKSALWKMRVLFLPEQWIFGYALGWVCRKYRFTGKHRSASARMRMLSLYTWDFEGAIRRCGGEPSHQESIDGITSGQLVTVNFEQRMKVSRIKTIELEGNSSLSSRSRF